MMKENDPKPPLAHPLPWLLVLGLVLALVVTVLVLWGPQLWALMSDKEAIAALVESTGIWAPVTFLGLQFLQIVVFIIPGEVFQLAGGYIFGVPLGLVLALGGAALGTLACYMVVHLAGRRLLDRLVPAKELARFESLVSSPRAQIGFFLLFLIPGLPKDILCYVGGLTDMGPWRFLLVSLGGRFPALLGSIIIGSSVAQGNMTLAVILGLVAALLFVGGLVFRQQIHSFLEARFGHKKEGSDDPSK